MKYHLCQGVKVFIYDMQTRFFLCQTADVQPGQQCRDVHILHRGREQDWPDAGGCWRSDSKKILILLFFVVDTQTMTASKLRKDDPSICKQKSHWSYINVYNFVLNVVRRIMVIILVHTSTHPGTNWIIEFFFSMWLMSTGEYASTIHHPLLLLILPS